MGIKGRLGSGAAGAAALFAYVVLGCPPSSAQSPSGEAAASLTVSVERPVSRRSETAVTASGTIAAEEEVVVSAEVGGTAVVDVLADEGDEVARGAVLARLDSRSAAIEARRQRALVAEGEATLASARANLERAGRLLASKSLSREAFEERETAVRTAEARADQAKAAAAALDLSLEKATVRAPASGYVSSRTAVAGSLQQQGAAMFSIVRDGRIELVAEVPQHLLPGVAAGNAATVATPDGRTVEGTVRLVSRRVDGTSRLGRAHVSVPAGSGLAPGMFAEARIVTGSAEALAVPERAVVWRDGSPNVFLVEDGRASIRPVVTGGRSDGMIAVLSGLSPDDRVVSLGAGFLNDGDRVAVAPAGEGTSR